GTQTFSFSGYLRVANESPADSARIVVEYRDGNENVLASSDTGLITSTTSWQFIKLSQLAPPATTHIRVRLLATRNSGSSNDAYFDGLSLRPVASAVALLSGTATDDGLPQGSTLTTTWSKVSGPGNATFNTPNAVTTGVVFDAVGSYV